MELKLDENNLKQGLLGLVMALVEIIRDALCSQAYRRIADNTLADSEVDRLGRALRELDEAIAQIKRDNGIEDAVRSVREGLDEVVDDVVDRLINPDRWREAT